MFSSKPVAAVLSVFAITSILVLIYTLQKDHINPFQAHYRSTSTGLSGSNGIAREEIDSLATQVVALRHEVEVLALSRTGFSGTTNDLNEQVHSLRDQLNDLSGQLNIDRSNPLDTGIDTAAYVQPPDEAEQEYLAQQQLDEAETDFRIQNYDPNWAEATENRIREGLTSPEYALPGQDLHMESLMDNLECRSTSCRLDFKDVDAANLELLQLQLLGSTAGLFSSGTFYQTENGEVVIYLHTM